MKKLFIILAIATAFYSCSTELTETEQSRPQNTTTENLIVITLDGLRWQEVFEDADVFDRDYLSTIGNLYGNRNVGNKVNVANPTNISYPGYHEIFTGNTTGILSNNPIRNPHKTVLEYINEQRGYNSDNVQVVSVGGFTVPLFRPDAAYFPIYTPTNIYSGGDVFSVDYKTIFNSETIHNEKYLYLLEKSISEIDNYTPLIHQFGSGGIGENNELSELLLYLLGKNILEIDNPKVMYFYFAMTDLFAHNGIWNDYTNAARNVGVYIKDLVDFVNTHPQYANNTTILITTDHGRGSSSWGAHSSNTEGADETWFILISPYTNKGIVNEQKQYYNEQLAQTMANILGFQYEADHEIAEAIEL
ncbi:MAG: alkaline phosphatase family protein [candidate division WOR-3 bacterium]